MSDTKIDRGTTSPKFALKETLGFLRAIDDAFRSRPASREAMTEALGHKPTSSAGGVKIGSMTHFGLLRCEGAVYEPSVLGKALLLPKDDHEFARNLAQAARSPTLYRKLFTDLAGRALPQKLDVILQRDYGVTRANADDVVKTFIATAEFAGLLANGVLHREPPEDAPSEKSDDGDHRDERVEDNPLPPVLSRERAEPKREAPMSQGYAIPISKGRSAHLHMPRPITEGDLERVKAWMDLMADVLTETPSEDDE